MYLRRRVWTSLTLDRKKRLYSTADERIRLVHTRVASDPNPHFDVAQCDIGVQIDNMCVHVGVVLAHGDPSIVDAYLKWEE